MQTRTDAQGNLLIWTGTGWQTIPKIAAGDLSFNAERYGPDQNLGGDSGYTQGPRNPADVGFSSSDLASKYGVGPFSFGSNNWQTSWDGSNKDAFDLLLKSADKEGSQVRYTLKDGQYVPEVQGAIPWDTNNGDQNITLALMALAAGGAAYANAGMAGAGAGTAGGAAGTGSIGSTVGQGTLSELMAGGLGGTTPATAIGTAGSGLLPTGAAGTLGGTFGGLANIGAAAGAVGGTLGGLMPTGAAGTLGGTMSLANALPLGIEATGGTLGGLSGTAASGLSASLTGAAKSLLSNPSALKALATVGGGLLGKATGGNDNKGGSSGPTGGPVQAPTMYGSGGGGVIGGWGSMGPTETERRMRQQYLPGLLGQGPWSN